MVGCPRCGRWRVERHGLDYRCAVCKLVYNVYAEGTRTDRGGPAKPIDRVRLPPSAPNRSDLPLSRPAG